MKIKWKDDGSRLEAYVGKICIGYVIPAVSAQDSWYWKVELLNLQWNYGSSVSEKNAKAALSRFWYKFLRKIGVEQESRIESLLLRPWTGR